MNNFAEYITPQRAHELMPDTSIEKFQKMADVKEKTCPNCDEKVWKFGQCGMCFSCTTGESDASDDYELVAERAK